MFYSITALIFTAFIYMAVYFAIINVCDKMFFKYIIVIIYCSTHNTSNNNNNRDFTECFQRFKVLTALIFFLKLQCADTHIHINGM